MGAFLLGAFALIAILLLLFGFVGANVKSMLAALRYLGATLLLLAAIGFAILDRFALALFAGSFAWGLFTVGRLWPWQRSFRGRNHQARQNSRPDVPGGRANVLTDWLAVESDLDGGGMTGRVRKGSFAGRNLDTLSLQELSALYDQVSTADMETTRLLKTFLTRKFGSQWRAGSPSNNEQPRPHRSRDSGMSRAEAWRVLGLEPGVGEAAIRAAHRRLILQNHPDRGGSSHRAAEINEAKDVLLSD